MKSLEELRKIREKNQSEMSLREGGHRIKIVVAMGTSGIAMGAREVMRTLLEEVAARHLNDVLVTQSGEKGLSKLEPSFDVMEEGKETVTYGNMTPEKTLKVIEEHILKGNIVTDYREE